MFFGTGLHLRGKGDAELADLACSEFGKSLDGFLFGEDGGIVN